MGLFRKKNRQVDPAMEVELDDNASIPREVRTKGSRKSPSRLERLLCGSSANKAKNRGDTKDEGDDYGVERVVSQRVAKGDSSTSSSGSSAKDARDDRPHVFHATTTKAKPEAKTHRNKDANSLVSLPPPAARAAFDGPPRFDWIDIEYNAATMIQAAFRRYIVLHAMEQRGMTTSFIRNRKRERKAKSRGAFFQSSTAETAPDLGFGCCVGFDCFGNDYNASDMVAYRTHQRNEYLRKKKAQKEREEFVSQSYLEQKGIGTPVMKLEQVQNQNEFLRTQSLEDRQ
mmetsp:Transcript_18400/g.42240  ORF Transcript_18400/g.42240 Transcript_18400/m.42240 type:complete len:286 (-) Transcript_18400:469-1326(-)